MSKFIKVSIIILLIVIAPAFLIVKGLINQKDTQEIVQEGPTITREERGDSIKYSSSDAEFLGTDVPLQGNDAGEDIDLSNLLKVKESDISDMKLEEVVSMFPNKTIYLDNENIQENVLYIVHATDPIGEEGSQKYVANLQHASKNVKIAAILVDNEWHKPLEGRTDEFNEYADDQSDIVFDKCYNFILNYTSIFLKVDALIMEDKNNNIILVRGDIAVA